MLPVRLQQLLQVQEDCPRWPGWQNATYLHSDLTTLYLAFLTYNGLITVPT